MAPRSITEKWLVELTHLPTASGLEGAVVDWARSWVGRRADLRLSEDSGGNLLITQKGRHHRDPVLAVAHMDHPAFVVTDVLGDEAAFEFRGGVRAEYFDAARVEFVTRPATSGRVLSYEPASRSGVIGTRGTPPRAGDIARWKLPSHQRDGHLLAPACDDLAGCAAALAALDRARRRPDLRHFGVLLTRAEEMGFVGALHAAKTGTIPSGARILSIETSRSSPDAPVGGGPVIRVGDAATVFDHDLTNRVSGAVAASGIRHQRKLMAGGVCEATAFGAFGYRATGLCLPLGNYHNMGNLDEVEAGRGKARPMLEEVSLADFHGLVDLLLAAANGVDADWDLPRRLDEVYSEGKHLLG
jgi:endoglucanase